MLGRGHDHAAELDERDATDVDGAAPREQQHAQRLLPLSRAWQRQRLSRKPGTCSADRVERVVLAAQSPLRAGVAADLEHRLAAIAQVASQPGAVVAGALDRPGTNAARVPFREAKRLARSRVRSRGPPSAPAPLPSARQRPRACADRGACRHRSRNPPRLQASRSILRSIRRVR